MTHVEREWDEQQQTHALALGKWRALQCPGCGGYLPDTTDPEAEDQYHCDPPYQCHKCVARSIAAKPYQDEPHPQSLLFIAKRRGVSRGTDREGSPGA